MAAESDRLSNQVVEPEKCSVCTERYTTILRKKTICKFCHASACSKCVEQYLLTRHEDAHCLHCRVNYNDATLHEICTKTYLNQKYFKHRQEVLINRERANLPLLQDEAVREKRRREQWTQEVLIQRRINELSGERNQIQSEHSKLYVLTYGPQRTTGPVHNERIIRLQEYTDHMEEIRNQIRIEKHLLYEMRWSTTNVVEEKKEEEKKKFVRRCTNNGCLGFLSTAWKCGLCEWYSCATCFAVKGATHDVEHECKKEDIDTAELIKKDCKPCPKCGEFIEKSMGCSQMFCISCQTPWDWNTGKIVTSGPIHNPHYYEWMKRTGGTVARNPADVPCGGFPGAWELVRFPRGMRRNISNLFYEFHRICMELQDVSTRQYRSHIDQAPLNQLNIKFLLGEVDEKKWGQLLAVHEKKRKRDAEIQEVLGAFRMVAVELINRVQNYSDGPIRNFTALPTPQAEDFLVELNVQIQALITMINDALRTTSITHSYSVPYIHNTWNEKDNFNYYSVHTKNFKNDMKKSRAMNEEEKEDDDSVASIEPAISEMSEAEQIQRALIESLNQPLR
jgi:hypothetical protein